jgi:hypothetical protein
LVAHNREHKAEKTPARYVAKKEHSEDGRGVFTWNRWDGRIWTTELLKYYQVEQFVQLERG